MKNQYRFFVNEILEMHKIIPASKELSHQILNVLRLHQGSKICAFGINKREFLCTLDIDKKNVFIKAEQEIFENTCPKLDLTMAISSLKADKIEIVLQKCTEIGVRNFILVPSEHSISRLDLEMFCKKRPRWDIILKEASEQCGGLFVPEIKFSKDFKDLNLDIYDKKIYAHKCEKSQNLSNIIDAKDSKILICIGSEGGFSAEELFFFEENDFYTSLFGERILRAETAAIVSAALALI